MRYVAVSRSPRVAAGDLARLCELASLQLRDDAAPLWLRLPAVVVPQAVAGPPGPDDYRVEVVESTPEAPGAEGYHDELLGRPSLHVSVTAVLDEARGVLFSDPADETRETFSEVFTHEVLEAFFDWDANLWVDRPGGGQLAFESCDPVQGRSYPKTLEDGTVARASDFVLPAYFDPQAPRGARTAFLPAGPVPFGVSPGGYLIVRDAQGKEQDVFGARQPVWKVRARERNPASRRNRRGGVR